MQKNEVGVRRKQKSYANTDIQGAQVMKLHNTILKIFQDFNELETRKVNPEDLRFTAKLSKEPEEHKNENDRMKTLASKLEAQRKFNLVA